MLITRLAKILMCLVLAVFCLLVAYDNITDPHSNYEFVQHVMSMDTTFPDNRLRYRAVTKPLAVADHLCTHHRHADRVRNTVPRRRHRHVAGACMHQPPSFHRAKAYAIAGALLAFLVVVFRSSW